MNNHPGVNSNPPQPTPTLRESIERTLVTYGGHAGNPQARMNLDNRIAELESLLSDRIREARIAENHAWAKHYEKDMTDELGIKDELVKLHMERITALQEKRNDNE